MSSSRTPTPTSRANGTPSRVFLPAAACLVLVLAAALAMTRNTLPAEIKVEGTALSSIPIPISQPAAMALDARGSLSGPLSPMLTIESKSARP